MPYATGLLGEQIYGGGRYFATRPARGFAIEVDLLDITDTIDFRSLRIENILTKEVDRCFFTIKSFGDNIFLPQNEQELVIYNNNVRLFGGIITKVVERMITPTLMAYDVYATDYTYLMDKKLVAEAFEDKTVDEIISSILSTYLMGFTINNVSCAIELSYVSFNYESVSQCLEKLATLVGYDWYVDYDKDIHFFSKGTETSPFNLSDTAANYLLRTLRINRNTNQLRNVIYVRGGKVPVEGFTERHVADGDTKVFRLGYKYKDIGVTVDGVSKTVGVENINSPDDYDCLYNFQEKIIKFRNDNKPNKEQVVQISGNPYLPIIVKEEDDASIKKFGKAEHIIIDENVKTVSAARERALSDITVYAAKLSEGDFLTHRSGLRSGQQITIQSDLRGIDENFIINKVIMTMRTKERMWYRVSIVTTQIMNSIIFLQKLLLDRIRDKELQPEEEELIIIWTFEDTFCTLADQVPAFTYVAPPWFTAGGAGQTGYTGFCEAS